MAKSTDAPTTAGSGYVLNFPTDGTSFGVRENLVDIVERELLGPIYGEEELLPFSPKQMYLVGLIAPAKLTSTVGSALGQDDADDLAEVRLDGDGVAEGRGVPAVAVDESEADAEEDDAEDRVPKQGLMIPASMGLRFQVPSDLASFDVTASWGTYETVETDEVSKAGRPIRKYQRTPVEETRTMTLAALTPGRTETVADSGGTAVYAGSPVSQDVRSPGTCDFDCRWPALVGTPCRDKVAMSPWPFDTSCQGLPVSNAPTASSGSGQGHGPTFRRDRFESQTRVSGVVHSAASI
jgi:hypothetical protein